MGLDQVVEYATAWKIYKELQITLPQLNSSENLKDFCSHLGRESHFRHDWYSVDVHITQQRWASTSGGWGGIGGDSISRIDNVIFINNYTEMGCVFWHSRLAYIFKLDPSFDIHRVWSLSEVPPHLLLHKTRGRN